MAWYKDEDADGLYELTIGSVNGMVYANTNSQFLFMCCHHLTDLDLSYFNTSGVTNMAAMFSGFYINVTDYTGESDVMHIKEIDLSNFDTSKVVDMNDMFRGCVDLTRLNISSFDTSKVKDMSGMFATTPVFVGSLADFGDISTYSPMSLEEIIGIESINTSSVENYGFVGMFQFNANLKRLDLSNFDTSKAIDLSSMFYGCSSLEYLNVTSFNTSRVTNMTQMFSNDESLTTIDLSSFDTSKVTSMSAMFMECKSLTSLDLSNFVTPKLTDMSDMFAAAKNLEYIDLSSFDVSKVTNYYQTFMSIRDFTVKMNGSSINSSADFTEMFSFSSPATIYVKTQADKQLLDGLNMYGVTVEVL